MRIRDILLAASLVGWAVSSSAADKAPPKAAMPRGNPGDWLTPTDYPQSALERRAEGTVVFQLDIGKGGEVTKCTVVQSSGQADLDDATCPILVARAHFSPATDKRGRPAEGTYRSRVRWSIPAESYSLPRTPRDSGLRDPYSLDMPQWRP